MFLRLILINTISRLKNKDDTPIAGKTVATITNRLLRAETRKERNARDIFATLKRIFYKLKASEYLFRL